MSARLAARAAIALWLAGVAICAAVVGQARFTTDMSAFLPSLATPMQRLFTEQLRDGVVSRLALVGIEGAAPGELAAVNRAMARRLAANPELAYLANGEASFAQRERDFLFAHRYLLSSAVTRERFAPAALEVALQRSYEALATPAGAVVRRYLPADPTGELLQLVGSLEASARPASHDGVWMSRDGKTSLMLAQSKAPGFDIDAQTGVVRAIEEAFDAARREVGVAAARLVLTGPGVFGVRSRDAMKRDVQRLSAVASVLVAALLAWAFRSPRLVVLAFLPVVSATLAGIAAVAAWFGTVHAITLGFGVTLIGEAVDYAIYLFSHRRMDEPAVRSLERIWRTLRLGVLISVCSFFTMLFSGFPGLAQLGLFSIVGLLAAAAVTRWVLPWLVPAAVVPRFASLGLSWLSRAERRGAHAFKVRSALLAAAFAVASVFVATRNQAWDDDIASLNPISAAERLTDERLRAEMGAPDVGLLVVASGTTTEQALRAAEDLAPLLAQWRTEGLIAGFDSPAAYLPSQRTQELRQAALPDAEKLRRDLERVVAKSPFQPGLFEPFLRDVERARVAPPLTRRDLQGTALALKVESMLLERADRSYALMPLRGVSNAAALAARLEERGAALLDLRRESAQLLATYRTQALRLWALGVGLIALLLLAHLRSVARVLRVLAPIAAAVAVTAAGVLAAGARLTLFHLVALLLVVGVGSNYALFFDRLAPDDAERRATFFALTFCAATTLLTFGLLAWSSIPLLRMIGTTVALGVAASFLCGALIARPAQGEGV